MAEERYKLLNSVMCTQFVCRLYQIPECYSNFRNVFYRKRRPERVNKNQEGVIIIFFFYFSKFTQGVKNTLSKFVYYVPLFNNNNNDNNNNNTAFLYPHISGQVVQGAYLCIDSF